MAHICPQSSQETNNYPSIEEQVESLQGELRLLREMMGLLQNYQRECVDKLDVKGAKQTRNRLTVLTAKQGELKGKIVTIAQDRHVMQISEEQEDLIQCFDRVWSDHLNQLVAELAHLEQKLKNEHKSKKEEMIEKYEYEKLNGFKPTTKLANLKRKVYGLMKMHRYEQAEIESQAVTKLQQEERRLWQQRIEERLKNALDVFHKKANKQFEVLRSKNQDTLFKKMNERDTKFAILLKKHQVRRLQASKSTKQLMKSISVTSLNTKRHP